MKYASQDLRDEHEGILFGLQILEVMVRQLRENQSVAQDDLKEMVHFFQLFADKCHHGKEEGLYFPSLEKAGVRNVGGPIGQMLLEHAEGRRFVARMNEVFDPEFSPMAFAEAADGYIKLLRAHIDKENNILFQMGDQKLAGAEQERLLAAFESFEAEVMGPGVHEGLHKMLDRFEAKYLG
jgi:hemerythrin-like domain-containing protein